MAKSEPYNLKPDRVLGNHYRIIENLGGGYEGEVYKVEELSTGIIRALKLFYKHAGMPKKPHVEYAKKLYRLRHCPVVIQYHHHDIIQLRHEPVDYLISDFVEGEVLSEYINRHSQKRIPPFDALHLFYALIKGVEHIHFIGEYHGDIHSDNIIVKRRGLSFDVNLIDLRHLGKPTKTQIQQDVFDLIDVFYEIIGGAKYYKKMPRHIKKIILGRKTSLIEKQFKTAGHLRLFIENFAWD